MFTTNYERPTKNSFLWAGLALLLAFSAEAAAPLTPVKPDDEVKPEPKPSKFKPSPTDAWPRIVFLGDSATDAGTYVLLVSQALEDAGHQSPICLNAGSSDENASQINRRIDRTVFSLRPDLVVVTAGVSDAQQSIPIEEFEASIASILARIKERKVPILILTANVLGAEKAAENRLITQYNEIWRRLAKKFETKLADTERSIREATTAGNALLEADAIRPNLEGHRRIARSVLDTLGCPEVELPAELNLSVLPGVVTSWKLKPLSEDVPPLTTAALATMVPDGSWVSYQVPETTENPQWWLEQERKRGVAINLASLGAPAPLYRGIASISSEKPRKAWLNTGAGLHSAWLNGHQVFETTGWKAWHPGRERIPVALKAGENQLVIESTDSFFVSLTDTPDWYVRERPAAAAKDYKPRGPVPPVKK